jgi:HemY protein
VIRLLVRFLLLAAAAAFFAWIADRPGTIVIRWMDREIQTSLLAGLVGILLLMFALWLLLAIVRRLVGAPSAIGGYYRYRRTRRGYEALSRGIIAAGAGDGQAAQRSAQLASRSLTDEPLLKLLEVQAAQIRGDRTAMKRGFEAMLGSSETEALGLRGLFAEARQAGDMSVARGYAERALKLNPRLGWASSALLAIQSAQGEWDGALATLESQRKAGQIDSETLRRKRAILLTAQALSREPSNTRIALDLALEAHRLDHALVPAAALAARVSAGSPRKVWKIVNRTWGKQAHPDLAAAYAEAKPGDSAQARFERVRELVASHRGGLEGSYALAKSAIAARQWGEARKVLDRVVAEGEPQARFCALMADLEESESGDKGKSREWLSRAVRAPRDPMWVIDGVAVPQWTAISPVTGEVANAEWRVPFTLLPGPTAPQVEAAEIPPEKPTSEEPSEAAEARIGLPQAEEPSSLRPAEPAYAPARPTMVQPIRPPDDPGPVLHDDHRPPNPALAGA